MSRRNGLNKTYYKNYLKELKNLFMNLGTIQFYDFDELAMWLGLDNKNNRCEKATMKANFECQVCVMERDGVYWLDYIPF